MEPDEAIISEHNVTMQERRVVAAYFERRYLSTGTYLTIFIAHHYLKSYHLRQIAAGMAIYRSEIVPVFDRIHGFHGFRVFLMHN